MKITVYETQRIKKEIDVEFPYYFSYEVDGCNIEYFGKIINENECFKMSEIKNDYGDKLIAYSIEIGKPDESYYRFPDKSSEYVFNAAKERMLKFIGKVWKDL